MSSGVCFLTGASGFVGANLAPMLAERYRLRCLVRPGQHVPALEQLAHERVEGSLEDEVALQRGIAGAELVVHLAAVVSFRPEDRAAMQRVNVDAVARIAAMARQARVRRMLHMSTISAVACSDTPRELDETATYNFGPLRIGYCDTKRAAEDALRAEVARGLDAVVVNPPSMYGAGDRRKSDGSLIDALLQGRVPFAPPGGINVANVVDVCRGCLQAVDHGRSGERYILGGENLTGRQLFERIARVVGSKPPLTAQILRLSPYWFWYSSRKAQDELGYRPGPVDPGIRAAAGIEA